MKAKQIIIGLLLMISMSIQSQEIYWEININKAVQTSNKTGKPMLLFFTGSDWCGWCIKLQNEVLKTPEFATWASKNVVLVELDFPRRTEQAEETRRQNAELQQTFMVQGYPTIWIANATKKGGKINFEKLGSTGYMAGGPSAWLTAANDILSKNTKKTSATEKPKKTKLKA